MNTPESASPIPTGADDARLQRQGPRYHVCPIWLIVGTEDYVEMAWFWPEVLASLPTQTA